MSGSYNTVNIQILHMPGCPWVARIFDASESPPLLAKIPELLMDTLAEAA
jgi:hypothetical protein